MSENDSKVPVMGFFSKVYNGLAGAGQYIADTAFDLHIKAESEEERDMFQRFHDKVTGRGPAAKVTAASVVTGGVAEIANQLILGSITLSLINLGVMGAGAIGNVAIRGHRYIITRKDKDGEPTSKEVGQLVDGAVPALLEEEHKALWGVAKGANWVRKDFDDVYSQFKAGSFKSARFAREFGTLIKLAESNGVIKLAPAPA